jgi:hypothetical protein
MDLQEDMVIEGIYTYTPQNIYMGPCKCIWQIFTLPLHKGKCKKNLLCTAIV